MRRLTHYDYWQQRLRPSILIDSGADLITYGLGEKPTEALVRLIDDKLLHGRDDAFASAADLRQLLHKYPIPQTVRVENIEQRIENNSQILPLEGDKRGAILLHSHAACLADRRKYAENFRIIEEESNSLQPRRLIQESSPSFLIAGLSRDLRDCGSEAAMRGRLF